MGLSMQEQLLKAGMVDKKQVKKAEHEKRVQSKKKKKYGSPAQDSGKIKLQQQAEQAKQDQILNQQRNQQAQRKADQAAVKQLIETNHLPLEEGEVGYHFIDTAGQIKRISVQQDVADRLSMGRFGLARYNNDFVLIPAETVTKVLARDKDQVLAFNDPLEPDDDYPTDW